jgi:YD repeat-containing protein
MGALHLQMQERKLLIPRLVEGRTMPVQSTCDFLCTDCIGVVGNPINADIGNKFERVTDYESAGPQTLAFIRSYNSQSAFVSSLGFGWQSNFDRAVAFSGSATAATAQNVSVVRPDGGRYSFAKNSTVWVPVDTDMDGSLTTDGATVWTFTAPDDSVDTFDFATGRLLSTRARDGYLQTLHYDANGHLASVTDSYNRTLTFAFANGVLQQMTDPDGKVYSYAYTTGMLPTPDRLVQVTYPGPAPAPTVQYLYENATFPFALTGVVDENGNRFASWTYDAALNAISSQHAGGAEQTTIAYSLDSNHIAGTFTTTNALGKQRVYTHGTVAGVGKTVRIDELAGATTPATTTTIQYDANGYIASRTDRNGNLTTYTRDVHGQVLSRTEATGTAQQRITTTTYHPTFHLPTQIVEPGRTTTFTYDAGGNLLSKVEADTTGSSNMRIWSYTWSATGEMLSTTDPLNNITTYAYDAAGALVSVTNALGQATQVTSHDASGRPLTVVDANGVTTALAYDPRGRLASTTIMSAAGNATTTIAYDAAGDVTQITRPDGTFLSYAFDAAHRLTQVSNVNGEQVAYTLDALGNRTQTQILNSSGSITKTQSQVFDELGRLLQSIGAAGQTTSFAYDNNGNRTGVTDPLSNSTSQAFDALNHLVQTTAPLSTTTDYAYDAQDNMTGVTDPRGLATSYSYDGLGNVLQVSSPDTGVTAYEVDAAGNRTQQTDAAGNVIQFGYDALNRLTAKTYPNGPAENVTYVYDQPSGGSAVGRLTGVNDESGSTAYVYDDRGDVVQETRMIGGVSYVTGYAYDLANHVTQMTYPSGRIVTYLYDEMGRTRSAITQANSGAQPVTVVQFASYMSFGPISFVSFGNRLYSLVQYDQDYQPSTRGIGICTARGCGCHGCGSVPVVQSLVYDFDAAGNITVIADNITTARSQSFQYDALQRLTQASGV